MKIVKIGDWDESEKELYGGSCGIVVKCETTNELIKLCTPEIKEALFEETELEIKVVKR